MPYHSNLKISAARYNYIKDAFAGIGSAGLGKANILAHKAMLESPTCKNPPKDLNKRLRWDCLIAALGSQWLCDNLYKEGLNDDHIDSALKSIMADLGI